MSGKSMQVSSKLADKLLKEGIAIKAAMIQASEYSVTKG
jgi:hypothetical protein